MKVKALRNVCVGVGHNLVAGDLADLDPGQVAFLTSIGAVEVVKAEPPDKPSPSQEPKQAEAKTAKPAEPSTKPKSGKGKEK